MSFLNAIKEIVFWEKDDDFFDKEATIKEYFAVCPPEQRRSVNSYEELYAEALKYVSKQSFAENTKDQENYFYEMNKTDASVAILTGVFAYVIARETDKNGKKLEKGIDKLLPKDFDKNNPFDTKEGGNHRYFGHDVLGLGLKNIPADFPIKYKGTYYPIGKVVGKTGDISMLDLIWKYYGETAKNPLMGIFNCAGHTIVHFAKDLLTSEGIPLPFSSLFNSYINLADEEEFLGLGKGEVVDKDDYLLTNKFNKKVEQLNGNLKASDFTSLTFIEGMCKLYAHSKSLGEKEKSFNRDIKIIAMSACIMIQMSSLLIGEEKKLINPKKGKQAMIPGAKMNMVMASAMLKNMVQEMTVVVKARHEVNVEYDLRLKQLKEGR